MVGLPCLDTTAKVLPVMVQIDSCQVAAGLCEGAAVHVILCRTGWRTVTRKLPQ